MATESQLMKKTDLQTAVRNRYFYGKLLDVYHFELETNYLNDKRWLLNRLVFGYGVVCGLDVKCGPDENTVIITPGVAIDKWGREIIVPKQIGPIPIPADLLPQPVEEEEEAGEGEQTEEDEDEDKEGKEAPRYREGDETWIKVMLCYHECESDPVPVLAGDCGGTEVCTAGTIREQYRVTFAEGRTKQNYTSCEIPDLIPRDRLDYAAMVRWVTDECPELPRNPCITLANVRVDDSGHQCNEDNVDINVRPIVYSNDLLYNLILSVITEHDRREK